MKTFIIGAAVTALLALPAAAADLPARAASPVATAYNWTGFYAGAHGGYGFGDKEWNTVGFGNEGAFDVKGWLGGAQLGYNFQVNQLVLGIEADGSFSFVEGERNSAIPPPSPQPRVIRVEVQGLGTIAGRLGFAWNNILVYGKGGAAFAYDHIQYTHNSAGHAEEYVWGWMAGAGFEYGLSQTLSFKAEYNYMDFGTTRFTLDCSSCPGPGTTAAVDLKQNIHVVKVGLNWRLWGPVVARY